MVYVPPKFYCSAHMRRLLTATLLPLLAGAIVLSVLSAVFLRAWNVSPQREGGARGRATETPGLAGHDMITGYKLATLLAVEDRGLVENVAAADAPDLSVGISPALDGGWNVDIEPRNFALALPKEYEAHVPGRGHVHLWVDGDYVDDFVTPRRWVPPLPAGVHEIVVSVSTVDHRLYARDGVPLVFRTYVRSADVRSAGPMRPIVVAEDDDSPIRVQRGELVRLDFGRGTERRAGLDAFGLDAQLGPASGTSFLFLAAQPGTFSLYDGNRRRDLVIAP